MAYLPGGKSMLCSEYSLTMTCIQVVQDIPSPIGYDIPMVLIKPPEACSTAEVYKVVSHKLSENSLMAVGWMNLDKTTFYTSAAAVG